MSIIKYKIIVLLCDFFFFIKMLDIKNIRGIIVFSFKIVEVNVIFKV